MHLFLFYSVSLLQSKSKNNQQTHHSPLTTHMVTASHHHCHPQATTPTSQPPIHCTANIATTYHPPHIPEKMKPTHYTTTTHHSRTSHNHHTWYKSKSTFQTQTHITTRDLLATIETTETHKINSNPHLSNHPSPQAKIKPITTTKSKLSNPNPKSNISNLSAIAKEEEKKKKKKGKDDGEQEREREREANLAEKKEACIGQINLYNFIITFSYSELLEKATHYNWVSNLVFESFDVVGIFVFWL